MKKSTNDTLGLGLGLSLGLGLDLCKKYDKEINLQKSYLV
jgi:hypothetical protein